jgi:Bacterial Ig-like domain (group 1)
VQQVAEENMKKIFLTFVLFILSIAMAGCGGGTGSSSQPSGVNPGVASVIKLMPIQSIAQTNSYIFVKAKVLDGNGNLLPGVPVTFTNLSLVGSLSATTATTDQLGTATVSLVSTTSGFSTVQAEVNTGAGMVRDKRTVFFSDYDLTVPSTTTSPPVLTLEVDGNNNGIYNEPGDFILFETPDDNQVVIRATLKVGDTPVSGSLVTFGSDTSEGSFPLGNTAHTDTNGQASVLVKVDPIVLRNFNTVLNITASADDGAANIISLFLKPVLIDTVSVTADPQTVNSGATSKISAQLSTTAGNAAPDGTAVNFTATNGAVTPFSQTTGGVAAATFTAPTLTAGAFNQQATITASSGGKSGTVKLTIVAPVPTPTPIPALKAIPTSQTLSNPAVGDKATYKIIGGVGPYSVYSDSPAVATVSVSGSTMTATVASVPAGNKTVTFTIYDSAGTSVTTQLLLDITGTGGGGGTTQQLTISPAAATITGGSLGNFDFLISGGTGGYSCVSSDPTIIGSPGFVILNSAFTINASAVTSTTLITITCTDTAGASAIATVTVNPPPFTITIDKTNVIGLPSPDNVNYSNRVTATIVGGTGPYYVISDQPALTPNGTWSLSGATPLTFQFYAYNITNVSAPTTVTLTAYDNAGDTATVKLQVFPQTTGVVVSVNKPDVIGLLNPDTSSVDDITFTVIGGHPPYTVSVINCLQGQPNVTTYTGFAVPGTATADNGPWVLPASGGTHTIDPDAPIGSSNVAICQLTATDNVGAIATPVTFKVHL